MRKRLCPFNSKLPIAKRTRSHRPQRFLSLQDEVKTRTFPWVTATQLRNYMIKDPLVDWLKQYRNKNFKRNNNSFTKFIMERGIEFEEELVKYIDRNIHPVVSVSNYYTPEGVKRTKELIKSGTPIIHSAPLANPYNRTYGIADLIVRSDYINNLVDYPPLTEEETRISAPKLDGKYHYRIIDIKFSTLDLAADGTHLLNSRFIPAYKAQIWVYNQALAHIQGYTPPNGYILGRRWKYTKSNEIFRGDSCLEKLGEIDFTGRDFLYSIKAKEAIKWYRDVQRYGSKWEVNPPSRPELYPNMCSDAGRWNKIKEELANDIGEISLLWYCGVRNRETGFTNNITSWRDERCCSELIGVNGIRSGTINKMIDINRCENGPLILPKKIKTNIYQWKKPADNELFVDFETIGDIFAPFTELPYQRRTDSIFMIGVGRIVDNQWKYTSFVCQELTRDEEFRIMNEFVKYVKSFYRPKLYYWYAEENFWKKYENRQFETNPYNRNLISNRWKLNNWVDLCKVFRDEPIVIKGCFGFGLKSIAKKMFEYKMISSKLDSECQSGMTAMVNAWNVYKNEENPLESPIMKDIMKYNNFDCKTMYDILKYLRDNHT